MDRENDIDRQTLASIAPGGGAGGFRLHDTHAAGRLHFGPAGGRPSLEMLDQLARAIPRWSKEAITYCVLLEGEDPFCAGWDMEALLAGDAAAARPAVRRAPGLFVVSVETKLRDNKDAASTGPPAESVMTDAAVPPGSVVLTVNVGA